MYFLIIAGLLSTDNWLLLFPLWALSGIVVASLFVIGHDAAHKALGRSGLAVEEIDLFEVNEAFAGVPLIFQREFGVPDDKLNVNGGSVALGHPLGSTGARMLTDLLCEL
ncbi:MAG: hypothetical protein P8P20_10800, partial [Acidimicrobiales bacterium]|nr:hypothetical protein [Acidimicrobiales bacterium]